MNKVKSTSISYRKVMAISVVFILILGISVIAGNIKPKNVKIKFSNNHEIMVLTSKILLMPFSEKEQQKQKYRKY